MRLVSVSDLRGGDRIARPVYNAKGNLLFTAGVVLSEPHLERMAIQGVRRVFVQDPLTDGIDPEEILSEATVARAMGLLGDFFAGLGSAKGSGLAIPFNELRRLVQDMRGDLEESHSKYVFPLETGVSGNFPVIHALNVAILSLGLAHRRGMGSQAIDIGVGALLHDVGKMLHPVIQARLGGGDDHSQLGFKFLGENPEIGAVVRAIVRQHHERLDGTGTPNGLTAGQILEAAQVVGLANAYDALVTVPPGATPQPAHAALEAVMAESGWGYEVPLVGDLIAFLVPYPIGRVVQLSDGRTGMVFRLDSAHLARPGVRILTGPGVGQEISLTDPQNLSLVILGADSR